LLVPSGVTCTSDQVAPPSVLRASPFDSDADKRPGCASMPVTNKVVCPDSCIKPPLPKLLTGAVRGGSGGGSSRRRRTEHSCKSDRRPASAENPSMKVELSPAVCTDHWVPDVVVPDTPFNPPANTREPCEGLTASVFSPPAVLLPVISVQVTPASAVLKTCP